MREAFADDASLAMLALCLRLAVIFYRSRRTLMDIVIDPTFKDPHHFKIASLTKTIAFPIEPQLNLGDPRLLLALLLVAITALLDAFLLKPARRIED